MKKLLLFSIIGFVIVLLLASAGYFIGALSGIRFLIVVIVLFAIAIAVPIISLVRKLFKRTGKEIVQKKKEEVDTVMMRNLLREHLTNHYGVDLEEDFSFSPRTLGAETEGGLTPVHIAENIKDRADGRTFFVIMDNRNPSRIGVLVNPTDMEKETLKREFAEKPKRIVTRRKPILHPATGIPTGEEEVITEEAEEEKIEREEAEKEKGM